MDNTLKDRITKGLIRYESSIEETDEHYDELDSYGRYPPDAPYGLKHLLPYWIHLLEEDGVDCENFRTEHARITQKLADLEEKRGRDYREQLRGALQRDVDHYPKLVSYFTYQEPFELELPHELSIRSAIEILLIELERDYDLEDLKQKISLLDQVLRCKYLSAVKKVLEYYPEAEDPGFPDRFWWRHPLKILKERQAMLTGS